MISNLEVISFNWSKIFELIQVSLKCVLHSIDIISSLFGTF